ncbi:hypothetical protein SEVIR_6G039300v4 [Setaria viridis]|uniref:Uncharacterized protein n=1 Tax=Setaria viridis TaxID=4556 RepID=A0A4U6U5N1_SETVI|nr:uncharacterized protein LOC117860055 isoform X1 [Setaria viridis]XP_034599152.1 uncharacterized protein LOC117860055 isoform X1 [Setaria viridis]TKW08670.1 hypothetical protein SEVIR_6G039300v2 [Setaria viridis]TKW08673.1 hypothetical protein SEVIR_6G039300v2 [Setaria viridis]TKW08676.1 hypothetical protein SEVIR_6G039300v2 [Setaria viridis]TKW08677.1 hypothetical protein SEVIR_6G039300v2 [Setaria viridis]TKW08678.1 hypothetical protein SEVIR_6G039300v2 [Setaria viridis]
MRKAKAATAASKPKAKPKPRTRAAPKAKPSPASLLSGGSSPSAGGSGTSSPAVDLSFFSDSPSRSPAKPRSRSSPLASPAASPLAAPAAMSTIGDLRSLAASHLDSLKRRLDALHGDSVRDLEASHSRLSKRVKMQTHGCLQLAEEADKEHKKVADKITERTEVVKNSYKKFVAEVQASTSRVCKVTVTEIAKSAERAIDGLRSRYNISATPA